MKSIYRLPMFMLIFITKISVAQTSNIPNLKIEKKLYSINANPRDLANSTNDQISFLTLDRETKRGDFIMLDDKTKKLPQKGKLPAIFWGIGGGLLYLGGNKLLFGGLDNASYEGTIISFATSVIIGTIVNQSKSKKRSTAKK